ncbi:MAG: Uma2 family endonuclease [Spirochaetaceae bacterium]|nr:MAG: Uma2 family endonuclease [Spirochaetaceae bacterium]
METHESSVVEPGGRYTIAERLQWETDEQWELINGIAYAMSPAPRLIHQRLLGKLFTQLSNQLNGKPCEPFIAPVDLYPFPDAEDERADTVVQPDLMIVCDPSQCREEGVFGAPDWILEILSASTAWKDQTEKKLVYQQCGVREYWILNPDNLDLIIYRRDGERFGPPSGANLANPTALGVLPGITLSGQPVSEES